MCSKVRSPLTMFGAGAMRSSFAARLGDEPAIEADGQKHSPLEHRRVSIRWLSGTILTGLCGAGLIGAAAYAALDQRTGIAEAPTFVLGLHKDDRGDASVNPRKADRLVKSVDIVAAKQTFKAPTVVKAGDKEIIKTKAFTSVSTTLTMVDTGLGDDIPPFDPLKLLTSARNAPEPAQPDAPATDNSAEVSFVTRPLLTTGVKQPAVLSADEAQAQVTEYLRNMLASGSRPALPLPPQLLLMRTSRAGIDTGGGLAYANVGSPSSSAPFSAIEVKMVPENVSLVPRTTSAGDRPTTQIDEKLAVIRRNDQLEDILKANGASRAAAAAAVAALGGRRDQVAVEGRRVKMLFADLDGAGQANSLARVSIHGDDRVEAEVAVRDDGRFVQVSRADSPNPAQRTPKNDDDDDDSDSTGLRLYESLYETAIKQDIPRTTVDELVRIFANDVDFQRPVSGGEGFSAFYEDGEDVDGRNTLLYASITTRGDTYRYYRYVTPDDGLIDFYDENGRSTRKFLIRQPVSAARITSGFGARFHPILGYTKVHTGVDFAAPIGTPIFAAGNGTVISAGWDSGYGRRVEIQHANGYITTYNHMSGFARGIAQGARVRQGQGVGFIGSTGLSTGPHLHYEIMVNGHFVDPMRVKLARTREFDGRLLADFRRERDRIEQLMARAPNANKVVATRQNGGG
jgi:murein DD-endopeptidase MepM/ murein hydrolase activator NlpD